MALQNARMHQESLKQQRLQQDLCSPSRSRRASCRGSCRRWRGSSSSPSIGRPTRSAATSTTCSGSTAIGSAVFIGDVSGKGVVGGALDGAHLVAISASAALAETDPARVARPRQPHRARAAPARHLRHRDLLHARREDPRRCCSPTPGICRRSSAARRDGVLERDRRRRRHRDRHLRRRRVRAGELTLEPGDTLRAVHRRRARGDQPRRRAVRLRSAGGEPEGGRVAARRAGSAAACAICAFTSARRRSPTISP